jgi:hypothetical protein
MTTKEPLQRLHVGFQEFYYDQTLGVYPKFSIEVRRRIKQKRATNATVSGEGGIGKSYHAIDICRGLSKRFTVDQVVFDLDGFLDAVLNTPMGVPIVFDEPSYAMSKREWYKDLNQALVKTIESFRYKVHPLFIPIINKSLLDKTIRSYLLQYQINVQDRGRATVYRLSPSQLSDKTYHPFFCELRYPLFDRHLCNKDSCLGCSYLLNEDQLCQIFRATYERKKDKIQVERYAQQLEAAKFKAAQDMTNPQIAELAIPHVQSFVKNGKINVSMLKDVLENTLRKRVGQNRAYDIRTIILRRLPQYDV